MYLLLPLGGKSMYINFYLADHDDAIAEYVGDVLEQMGLFKFKTTIKKKMNVLGRVDEVVKGLDRKIKSRKPLDLRVNLFIFFTKWIEDRLDEINKLNDFIRVCKSVKLDIYVITDEHMSGKTTELKMVEGIRLYADFIHVGDCMWDLDLMNLSRAIAQIIIRQDHNLPEGHIDDILSGVITSKFFKDDFLNCMFERYMDIPKEDKHTRVLLLFSIFKYAEANIIRSSNYRVCADYLYRRDIRELLINEEDIKILCLCLSNDLIYGQRRLSVV